MILEIQTNLYINIRITPLLNLFCTHHLMSFQHIIHTSRTSLLFITYILISSYFHSPLDASPISFCLYRDRTLTLFFFFYFLTTFYSCLSLFSLFVLIFYSSLSPTSHIFHFNFPLHFHIHISLPLFIHIVLPLHSQFLIQTT